MIKRYTELELLLQQNWGFPESINYHKFWNRPKCTCVKMDNDDAYPVGYYSINMHCPLHGI